jgi:hypothetical protein
MHLEEPTRRTIVKFTIKNKGNVPAENLLVEFGTKGAILIEPPDIEKNRKGKQEYNRLPQPPKPPKGEWIHRLDLRSELDTFQLSRQFLDATSGGSMVRAIPPRRDRNAFYWKTPRPLAYSDKWAFECDEFRHQVHVESFDVPVYLPREESSQRSAIACTITAKNLPRPVEVIVPIVVERVWCSTEEAARSLIGFNK